MGILGYGGQGSRGLCVVSDITKTNTGYTTFPAHSRMGIPLHSPQMVTKDVEAGSPNPIRELSASVQRDCQNRSEIHRADLGYDTGDSRHAQEGSGAGGPARSSEFRLLRSLQPGSEETRRVATRLGSLVLQRECSEVGFQDADYSSSEISVPGGRLVCESRSERRILSRSCNRSSQEIPAFLVSKCELRVCSSTIRVLSGSTHLYDVHESRPGTSKEEGDQSVGLPRRLDSLGRIRGASAGRYDYSDNPFDGTRLCHQLEEKRADASAPDHILGLVVGHSPNESVPFPGEEDRCPAGTAIDADRPARHGQTSKAPFRPDGSSNSGDASRPAAHEVYPEVDERKTCRRESGQTPDHPRQHIKRTTTTTTGPTRASWRKVLPCQHQRRDCRFSQTRL